MLLFTRWVLQNAPYYFYSLKQSKDGREGNDGGMRHRRFGQFPRVAASVHRTADSDYSVRRAVGNISCCSFVCLLSEAFAVDETSKHKWSLPHPLNPLYWVLTLYIPYLRCLFSLLSHQGYNASRLLEPDDAELDNNQRDYVSKCKEEAPSGTTHDKVLL